MNDEIGNKNLSQNVCYRPKIREEYTIEADSRIWNEFEFRMGDVIIASYHKAGTTVTQQIISQLIYNGQENIPVAQISPWLDFRLNPKEQILAQLKMQNHRRFIKTHLLADALPISPLAKYIYVARDGRDIAWSFHHHLLNAFEEFNFEQWKHYDPEAKILKGYPIIPESPHQFFIEWLRDDGFPHGSFFENVKTWWNSKSLSNVLLIHYNNIKNNLLDVILQIAEFLDISTQGLNMDTIFNHCSFKYMKEHSMDYAPMEGKIFKGGADSFFYKGTNQRWLETLSVKEIQDYEQIAEERLGKECSYWLATGRSITTL